jgi:hypothetical protein
MPRFRRKSDGMLCYTYWNNLYYANETEEEKKQPKKEMEIIYRRSD